MVCFFNLSFRQGVIKIFRLFQGPMPIEEGAVCPSYLALIPPNVSEPKGAYLWSKKQIIDWVEGPTPGIV